MTPHGPSPRTPEAPAPEGELVVSGPPGGGAGAGWRRWSRRGRGWVPAGALALALYLVPLPYFVVSPGPARDVLPLIAIENHEVHATDGRFLLTSVYVDRANPYEAVKGWVDPLEAVVHESEILAPGETEEESRRQARSDMDTSKIDAAVVVLSEYTDYPARSGAGALVEAVFPGTPAEGRLFPGDVILEVDGRRVDGPDEVGRVVRAAGEGTPVAFLVEAGGERESIRLAPARVPGQQRPVIGVSLVANFPFPVSIESGDVGGPSAGLMWTLGLAELLTPGDLARGRAIAGTGTVSLDGTVGPVGGVEEKVVAAERAGADLFVVPRENERAARAVAEDMPLVVVSTWQEAVRHLESDLGSGR